MVRTTAKPASVEEAKARLRAKVAAVDYLAPLRSQPLPLIVVGVIGGVLTFRAMKKGNSKLTTGLFELGMAAARKWL